MTKKLKDSIHQMLQLCYRSSDISAVIKSFLKDNREELYNKDVWLAVVDKIKKRFELHNNKRGTKLSLGNDTDTLFLALGLLNAGDEQRFHIQANQYFEANGIK